MATRRVVIETRNGPRYLRDGWLVDGRVALLKLTTAARWAKRFTFDEAEDWISGVNAAIDMGFYSSYKIEYAS